MKTFMRSKRASRSTIQKIERAIRAGWQPGISLRDALKRRRTRTEAGSNAI
jgi:hypothetical protein